MVVPGRIPQSTSAWRTQLRRASRLTSRRSSDPRVIAPRLVSGSWRASTAMRVARARSSSGTFSCPWFFPCLLRKSPPDPGRFSSAVDIWDRRLEVRRPRSNNQSQISCVTSRAAGWGARRQEGRCVVVGQGRAAVPARGPAGGSGPTYWSRRTGGCCPLRRQRSRSTDRVQLSGRQCRRRCWSPKRELPASGMNPLTERYGFDTVVTPPSGPSIVSANHRPGPYM